jgi:hypothetical protein
MNNQMDRTKAKSLRRATLALLGARAVLVLVLVLVLPAMRVNFLILSALVLRRRNKLLKNYFFLPPYVNIYKIKNHTILTWSRLRYVLGKK